MGEGGESMNRKELTVRKEIVFVYTSNNERTFSECLQRIISNHL